MDEALGLVKIHSLGNVLRNQRIVLPNLGDAIHLHGHQNWNILALQIASQQHGCRCSPAVTEQDDSSTGLFRRGKYAIMVGI